MNVEKFTKQAAPNIFDHCGRSESTRKCDRSNQEIHPERSHLNYNLAAAIQPKNPIEYLNQRLSEIYVHGNASVAFASWTITAPKTLKSEEEAEFFKHAYDRFVQIYGEKNVISCFVHLDERSPHMHFCFVPITEGKHGEKLCAKIVIDRKSLNKMHPDMEKYVSEKLGHHVDILTGATREGNLAMKDYKRKKALEDIQKAEEKAAEIIQEAEAYKESAKKEVEKIVSEAIEVAEEKVKDYEMVSVAYESKKEFIEKFENSFEQDEEIYGVEEHEPTPDDPKHYFKVPADIWYRQKVSKDMVEIYKESQNKAIQYADKLVEYEQRNRKLISENITLSEKLEQAKTEKENHEKWIIKFKTALRKLAERIPNFKKIFKEVAEEVDAEEKAAKEHNRYIGERDFRTDPEH